MTSIILKIKTNCINKILCGLVLILASCSPSQFVKPLAKKEQAVNASFGGPMIANLGAPIPIPFINVNYGYGIDSATTLWGGLNLTSALFGNFQTQLGATRALINNQGAVPGVAATVSTNIIYRNTKAFNFYPQLDINAWWSFGKEKQHYFYTGLSNWFEVKATRAHNEPQLYNWFLIPQAGVRFKKNSWSYFLETKLIAPNVSNRDIVVNYVSPVKNHGAFGVYLGISKTLGK
ncbi:MAG: hypothetical protein IT239_01305 [Bacteroidia bacterium]|nr:hypothetical protein [Bacteroidia bacterium]